MCQSFEFLYYTNVFIFKKKIKRVEKKNVESVEGDLFN